MIDILNLEGDSIIDSLNADVIKHLKSNQLLVTFDQHKERLKYVEAFIKVLEEIEDKNFVISIGGVCGDGEAGRNSSYTVNAVEELTGFTPWSKIYLFDVTHSEHLDF